MILLGNPFRQIRIPSSTPLHCSWLRTKAASIIPVSVQTISYSSFLAAQGPPRTCCEARFYKVHTFSENHFRCAYEIIISSVSSQSIYYTWYLYTEIALSRYKPDYYSTEWCRTLSPSCGEAKRLMAYNG